MTAGTGNDEHVHGYENKVVARVAVALSARVKGVKALFDELGGDHDHERKFGRKFIAGWAARATVAEWARAAQSEVAIWINRSGDAPV